MTTRAASGVLSRRELVVFGAQVIASGVAVSILGCSDHGSDDPLALDDLELPTCFTEIASMQRVGRRYLELHPSVTLPELLDELAPGRGFDALEAEIREQYARGETVSIDRWPLALTEIRIYAVVALSA